MGAPLWTDTKYGKIAVNGKQRPAHRVAYELYRGPIPDGMLVCHKCDVRVCVNPDHLFLGTHADNMRDRSAKGRTAIGERSRSTLSNEDALTIHRSTLRTSTLARKFGVSEGCIFGIRTGVTWTHVTGGANALLEMKESGVYGKGDERLSNPRQRGALNSHAKLNEKQVLAIRCDGRSLREIASEYGISPSLAGLIKNRKVWQWL